MAEWTDLPIPGHPIQWRYRTYPSGGWLVIEVAGTGTTRVAEGIDPRRQVVETMARALITQPPVLP